MNAGFLIGLLIGAIWQLMALIAARKARRGN